MLARLQARYQSWQEARKRRKAADEAFEHVEALLFALSHADWRTGVCCCGGDVDAHGWGDGHSPVDSGEYHIGHTYNAASAFLSDHGKDIHTRHSFRQRTGFVTHMSTLKDRLEAAAREVLDEPIFFSFQSRNGPVECWKAMTFGSEFVGRDDPIHDAHGSGARAQALDLATQHKAGVMADRFIAMISEDGEEDAGTRV